MRDEPNRRADSRLGCQVNILAKARASRATRSDIVDREFSLIACRFGLHADRDHENGGEQHQSTNAKHRDYIAAAEIFKGSGDVASSKSGDVADRVDQGDTRGGRCARKEP